MRQRGWGLEEEHLRCMLGYGAQGCGWVSTDEEAGALLGVSGGWKVPGKCRAGAQSLDIDGIGWSQKVLLGGSSLLQFWEGVKGKAIGFGKIEGSLNHSSAREENVAIDGRANSRSTGIPNLGCGEEDFIQC